MLASVELQVISKILTTESQSDIDTLCGFDSSYYSVFSDHIKFIFEHRNKYGTVPDVFTFQAEFPDITLVHVDEPIEYLVNQLVKNKQRIMLMDLFNKLKDLGSGDISEAWQYISMQCDNVAALDTSDPMDIVHDAKLRSQQIIDFNKQTRIPTGFAEIDKLMYGGLSTVEELLLIIARTNSGKSWLCTKMMESAQRNGFPVLYYSPEMQSSFLGTRFDTWRGHFQNSQLFQGKYDDAYLTYLDALGRESTPAYILEDKDMSEGVVNVENISNFVRKHGIKLVIIDGLSYMIDIRGAPVDHLKYKNICLDLFRMSKQFGCAVVVAVQANRETRDNKDDKGEPFPNLYNIEGSDHPARIATQVFALRQVFDKHVLDIRLEKSRNAANQKPVLSYAWDVNTGNMQYLPGGDDSAGQPTVQPVAMPIDVTAHTADMDSSVLSDADWEDDVEF